MSAQLTMSQDRDRMPPQNLQNQHTPLRPDASRTVTGSSAHYNRLLEISHVLHSSLMAEDILQQFSVEISKEITLDGLSYTNAHEKLEVHIGTGARHTLEYVITLPETQLGRLQISRKEPFTESEIALLEDLTTALVYPLHNAFSYARAVRSSFLDPLTGASNRAALKHDLERECALSRRIKTPFSVLLLDIDHFKNVNDNWGHQCGDQALKAVVETIRQSSRSSDMLYRYGGEEFLLILACTPAEGAKLVAERIRKNIEAMPIDSVKGSFSVTASLGIATINEDDNCYSLVNRADDALYQAKRGGRNLALLAE